MELERGTSMGGPDCMQSYNRGRDDVLDSLVKEAFWKGMKENKPKLFKQIKEAIAKAEKKK